VDDLADAACFLLQQERHVSDSPDLLNVGTGEDIAIVALAHLIKDVVGFEGAIEHDLSKPDGTPRKLMDVSLLSQLGWKATIPLREGVKQTYEWYLSNVA
jgi:GDP-L-fucose synthase